ncbi:TPA: hypothetical protein DIV49_03520 [Candidatus Saccharibacteria bacterium]|nr:hypothetical protein [Candidatus Saccharibacteria bacterium]HRJ91340.1 YtxH domain-containing protein [Candidatus Saccharibacteria bacterium]
MSKGKFALGAIVGAVIGAVAGLLTAPKTGKETREDLYRKADKLKTEADKKTKEAVEMADTVKNDVKAKADELKSRTENAVEGAKSGFNKPLKK